MRHSNARSVTALTLLLLACGLLLTCGRTASETPIVRGSTTREDVHLAEGWTWVDSLDLDQPLAYREDRQLHLLRPGDPSPCRLNSPRGGTYAAPVWSEDGRFLFDDSGDVRRIDIAENVCEDLTSYPRRTVRTGTWRVRRPAGRHSPFVHDAEGNRLLYMEAGWFLDDTRGDEMVSLDLDSLARTPLPQPEWATDLRSWTASLSQRRVYVLVDSVLHVWGFDGREIAERKLSPDARSPELSHDGRHLVVERWNSTERELGCWILDERSLATVHSLDHGSSFRWSPVANELAYLRRSEQLWILELDTRKTDELLRLDPREEAPEWSRDRYSGSPAWSCDGRRLACTLARWDSRKGYASYSIVLDRERRQAWLTGGFRVSWSWAPR